MPERYDPATDGRAFRDHAFHVLAESYWPTVAGALDILNDVGLEFPALDKAHSEQLRPDLLFRHSIPFCVTEEAFFGLADSSRPVLAALLAGHTLALTHLDYHLDGSGPATDAAATARKMPVPTAVSYSVRMVYAVGRIVGDAHLMAALFAEVFDPVSGFVLARMHEDWLERYTSSLSGSSEQLEEYLQSPLSRLGTSRYWEVMVRGSFVGRSRAPHPGAVRAAQDVGRLRQVVDEIADFHDDLAAGLVTSPLLFALAERRSRERLRTEVRELWAAVKAGAEPDAARSHARAAAALVTSAGGFDAAARFADDLWRSGARACAEDLGERGGGYQLLFDLKRAKLRALEESGWSDASTRSFVAGAGSPGAGHSVRSQPVDALDFTGKPGN